MRSRDQSGGRFRYMSPKNVSFDHEDHEDHEDLSSGHFPSMGGGGVEPVSVSPGERRSPSALLESAAGLRGSPSSP